MSLRDTTFSAVRWTTIAALVGALLQIAQVAVLARLLSPEDYGLMAIVGVVTSLAVHFSDFGLNSAYVQKQNVTLDQRSSLFLLNIGTNGIVTALLIGCSPFAASFFSDERIAPLMVISGAVFLVNSFGQQFRLTLEKTLTLRPVVLLDIIAGCAGFCTATVSALMGLGVYSIVIGSLATAITGSSLAWRYLAQGWRPKLRFRWHDVRPFMGFGGALAGNNIVNQISSNIDLLLGGRLLAASQLGLYSVPRNLVLQLQFTVNPIITRVAFPLIAQVQSDLPRVKSIYLKTLNMTSSINAPLYLGLAFFAPEAIHVLLGSTWEGAAEFLPILSVWAFVRSTSNPVGSLLLGMGRADLALKWNLAMLLLILVALWLGSHFGMLGLAWALLGHSILAFIMVWFFLVRPLCKSELFEYAKAALTPLSLALFAILPGHLVATQLEDTLARLIVGVFIAIPLYLILSFFENREWIRAMLELSGRKI